MLVKKELTYHTVSERNDWGIIEEAETLPPWQRLAAISDVDISCLVVMFLLSQWILWCIVRTSKGKEKWGFDEVFYELILMFLVFHKHIIVSVQSPGISINIW